ncbi:MAG: DedA family protein [Myxococcaceae bacterium]|nr:DedA family protein [Myxococcaceae bacterium]
MEEQLVEWLSRFSYPAVYALLAATGTGLPIPEDVVLLTAGTLCSTGHGLLYLMIPVAAAGVLTGDTLLFRIGAKLGPKVIEHPKLKAVLTPARVASVRGRFDRYGVWTVFVARFVPGIRAPTFLLAGSMGVPQKKFWLADGLAVCFFAPLMLWLGLRFGPEALPYVRQFGGYALLGVATLIVAAWAWSKLRPSRAP